MTVQKKRSPLVLKIILPLIIIIIGLVGFKMLGNLKKTPQRQQPSQQGILVDVLELETITHQVKVHATGTVKATQEIVLIPEVSGKIIWISPKFVAGGFFAAGDELIKIDPIDFQLAIKRYQANIAQVEVAIAMEQERAKISLTEWEQIDITDKGEPGALVSHEIQLYQQQASLAAAKAELQQAQLKLQRTTIKAPFNGRIRQEQVGLGQYLRAGSSIGTFAGTDHAEIHVPLPLNELVWLNINTDTTQNNNPAIIYPPDNDQINWQGTLVRSYGEIDPHTRMATVVVTVDDPYGLKKNSKQPILANGMFVDIELFGEKFTDIISIPRKALHANNLIWIADDNNHLNLRQVKILRREKQQILISAGANAGERLILTTLAGATEGTLLRPVLQEKQP